MRTPVAVALAVVVLGTVVAGVAVYGLLAGPSAVEPAWVADTGTGIDSNHHRPAVVETDDGPLIAVPLNGLSGTGDCRVTALDAEGQRRWHHRVPPADCHAHAVGDVSVGAFPGEGPSVLVATGGRRVVALDASGREQFAHGLPDFGYSAPTLVDDRLVAVDFFGTAVAVEADGTESWRRDLGYRVWAPPAVLDVDGDRTVVVAGGVTGESGTVTGLDAAGEEAFTAEFASPVLSVERTVVGGDPAVVVATRAGTVAAISARDGEELWRRSLEEGARVAVGDQRAFVVHEAPTVRALSLADGRTLWETTVGDGGDTPSRVAVATTADHAAAPVVATPDGTVAVLSPRDGDVLGSHDADAAVYAPPTAADVTGDGTDELVVVYGDGRTALLTVDIER